MGGASHRRSPRWQRQTLIIGNPVFLMVQNLFLLWLGLGKPLYRMRPKLTKGLRSKLGAPLRDSARVSPCKALASRTSLFFSLPPATISINPNENRQSWNRKSFRHHDSEPSRCTNFAQIEKS